jgi:hypothetical protein
MSERIEPGYPDEYLSAAPRYIHRDSSPALNFASTPKINGPDLSFFASHFLAGRRVQWRLRLPFAAFVK